MPRIEIKYDDYKIKAFLDSNIILECRPLFDLPWDEVDCNGPILALITPTAIKEIDSKKQDGRLAKRAREFNRLIASVATGGPPIVIREADPRVELALSRAILIPWDRLDDLDPGDGDSCIVAEALYAKDMNANGKLVVSHDIKPIAFASNYDMDTHHVSDNWLRPAEPSQTEREIQRLRQKISDLEVTQPAFAIDIEVVESEPISIIRVEDLSDVERIELHEKIVGLHPKTIQKRDPFIGVGLSNYDSSYDERYEAYIRRLPDFVRRYEQNLEKLFNQARFKITVTNIGKVQAENLLLEIQIIGGWLHDRYAFASPDGPSAPTPRPIYARLNQDFLRQTRVARHEIDHKEAPNCEPTFSVTCEDFRHGQKWIFEGIMGLDARTAELAVMTVVATASNYRGTFEQNLTISSKVKNVHISELVDLDTSKITFTAPLPMAHLFERSNVEDLIDFSAFESKND